MLPQLLSGQRVAIRLQSDIIAYGMVVDFNIDTQVTEVRGIDSVLPIELYPSSVRVTLSLRVYRTPDNDPGTLGILPSKMTDEGDQAAEAFAARKYLSVEVRDQQTDKIVMYFPRVMLSSRSGSVSSEDLMMETWSMVSIGYQSN